MSEPQAWLLTVNDWFATREARHSDRFMEPNERVEPFYARGDLTHALKALKEYERLFMRRYPMTGLTLRLLSFAPIPPGTDLDALQDVGATDLDANIARLREEIADME